MKNLTAFFEGLGYLAEGVVCADTAIYLCIPLAVIGGHGHVEGPHSVIIGLERGAVVISVVVIFAAA